MLRRQPLSGQMTEYLGCVLAGSVVLLLLLLLLAGIALEVKGVEPAILADPCSSPPG